MFTKADYPAISRIALQTQPETQLTAARLLESDRTRARHLETGGFVVEVDGQTVGFIRYTQYADLYQPEKVVLFGAVLPDRRGQGIGSELLNVLERHLPSLGVSTMQTQVSQTDTAILHFLQQRGFAEMWRRLDYRLNLREADSRSLEALASKLENRNVRVTTYPELAADPARDEKLRALNSGVWRETYLTANRSRNSVWKRFCASVWSRKRY